ncbi:MAG TPA: SRPBCC domain-containing protein [Acidimicrobiia bacterium]|nr:SRPBCC domain-containing protein [Acidimicrobiia bacterium]
MAHDEGLTLRLQRVLPGVRTNVFRACTEPDELALWWGPHGFTTTHIELDLRVGGRYRLAMQPPDGEPFHIYGEYRAIDPPAHLEYTFLYEPPDPEDRETIVTASLRDLGNSTEFDLVQSGFATEGRRALHEVGWTESLERLDDLLVSRGGAGD